MSPLKRRGDFMGNQCTAALVTKGFQPLLGKLFEPSRDGSCHDYKAQRTCLAGTALISAHLDPASHCKHPRCS